MTSASRPFFKCSIGELERLVQHDQHDPAILARIMGELTHRETDRAARLRARITALQDGLELRLPNGRGQKLDDPVLPGIQPKPETPLPNAPLLAPLVPRAEPLAPVSSQTIDFAPLTPQEAPLVMDPLVIARMRDLIDYVIAIEKDKLKLVTDVSNHPGFHRSHDQLAGLPGVTFNQVDGYASAWLHVERLNRRVPPEPADPRLREWIILADEPAKEPYLREFISSAECSRIGIKLDEGAAGIELAELADLDGFRSALRGYIAGPWSEWSISETSRRKTIALYGSLFALRQTLAAPDSVPQELVCGIGYAALERQGKRLRYPLLTIALDIEIDPFSHVIALVPRDEVKPTVEADPLDALGLTQVDAWRREALRALSGLEDDPLSPFIRETFEQILYQATALLDPNARYDEGTAGAHVPPPNPGPELVISDAFGFFQRERRATQLMADLLAFRDLLDKGNDGLIIPPRHRRSVYRTFGPGTKRRLPHVSGHQ